MKTALKHFWEERDERERKMLAVLAPVLVLTLIYLLVARPIAAYIDDAERNLTAAEREYAMVMDAIARTQAARSAAPENPVGSVRAFPTIVRQAASEAQVPVTRTQENGNSLNLWIEKIEPAPLFSWLDTIERKHGIYVDGATMSAIEDGTHLRVQLTLKYREQ